MSDRSRRDRDARIVPQKPEHEVDDELHFHLERRIQANIARGMPPGAARAAALARFGNVAGVRDECTQLLAEDRRAEARRDWFDDLHRDLRFAVRAAGRAPLFSLLAVVTLALGIGANAAVFGVVKSVLLDALPYRDAGQLVRVYAPQSKGQGAKGALSAGTVSDLRERQHSFMQTGAFVSPHDGLYSGERPEVLQVALAEPAMFKTLGVTPLRGPGFTAKDATHDTATVAMLSNAAWHRLFGGDPNAIGRVIRVNGLPRTIVGVLPRSFVPPDGNADVYLPLDLSPYMRNPVTVRGSHNFGMVARLRPGITAALADREMRSIGAELERLYAKDNLGISLSAVSLRDAMVGETRTPLLILLASAALVLLIMCANLAGALLSRTISRRKEFAVRVALGAGRGRLVRQLLTESVLLAAVGGVAGILLAELGLRLLRGLALNALPAYASLSLDPGAISVAFALAVTTGLAFGAGPAISVGRADPQGTLREQTRGTSESRRTRRLRGALVAGQIALCVSLLAAAGLLARSLWALTTAPAGFNPRGLLTFSVRLPDPRWTHMSEASQFYDTFLEKLRALPGVTDAAVASAQPMRIMSSNGLFIQDAPWGANEAVPFVLTSVVSESYFHTLGVPLVEGRVFTNSDRADMPPMMVINQAMAKKYWPGRDPVGAHVHIGPPDPTQPWITIVGVVGDTRNDPASLRAEPIMYLATRQEIYGNSFVVRTSGDPTSLTVSIRRVLESLDPGLPLFDVATMSDMVDQRFAARRLPVVLMSGFGVLALLLASVGVYAMFATMAAAREREFGVRVALGSTRGAIATLVLWQGGVWMGAGLGAGALGVAAAARALRTQLYGIPPLDPVAIGAAVLVLLVCAGVALLAPVRRASRVDPITVLR